MTTTKPTLTTPLCPLICISCGDPAGIGAQITLEAAQQKFPAKIVAVADPDMLKARAKNLTIDVKVETVSALENIPAHTAGTLFVIAQSCAATAFPGKLDVRNSPYVLSCIDQCVDLCLQGSADAMVTAPVHKAIINHSGVRFFGHTQWIAERCGQYRPVMMLADQSMKVCLATIHIPLSAVPTSITIQLLAEILEIMHHDIGYLYGIQNPILGVCGLNPHAGEDGLLGDEEIQIITPALARSRSKGIDCRGPFPADTLFTRDKLATMDGVLAMYHDQGLPVIKHAGFGKVVNITLGLPIIRTSVDHGTALDIAASGSANPASLIEAINLSITFANNKQKGH